MSATLKLIPISRNDCRDRLRDVHHVDIIDDFTHSEDYDVERRPITLMLCTPNYDIIDVDTVSLDELHASGPVCYGSRNEVCGLTARVPLGQNSITGIHSAKVSRDLCVVVFRGINVNCLGGTNVNEAEGFLRISDKGELMIKADPPKLHRVYLNGYLVQDIGENIPIRHRSIIALHGATAFAYEVQILQATTAVQVFQETTGGQATTGGEASQER